MPDFAAQSIPARPGLAKVLVTQLEHDNFRAALAWALERDPVTAMRLASLLSMFWVPRGYSTEGRTWLQAALERAEALPPAEGETAHAYRAARARALIDMVGFDFGLFGNVATVRSAAEEGITLARQVNDLRALAAALGAVGMMAAFWGEPVRARASAEEALALSRETGDLRGQGLALGTLSILAFVERNLAQGRIHLEEGLRLAHRMGNPWVEAQVTMNLGRLAAVSGDMVEARQQLEASATLFRQVGDFNQLNGARSELAHGLRRHGDYEAARALYRETIQDWRQQGHRGAVAHQLECLAFIAGAQGQGRRAARLLGAAECLREASNSPMIPYEWDEYKQIVSGLRSQVGESDWAEAWAEGRALTLDQAVAFALENTEA